MTLSVPSFLAAATSASMPPNAWALVAVLLFFASPLASLAGGAQAARPTSANATAHAVAPRTERVRTGASSILRPRGFRPPEAQATCTEQDRPRPSRSGEGRPLRGRGRRSRALSQRSVSMPGRSDADVVGRGILGTRGGWGARPRRRRRLAGHRATAGHRLGDGLRGRCADLRAGVRPGG